VLIEIRGELSERQHRLLLGLRKRGCRLLLAVHRRDFQRPLGHRRRGLELLGAWLGRELRVQGLQDIRRRHGEVRCIIRRELGERSNWRAHRHLLLTKRALRCRWRRLLLRRHALRHRRRRLLLGLRGNLRNAGRRDGGRRRVERDNRRGGEAGIQGLQRARPQLVEVGLEVSRKVGEGGLGNPRRRGLLLKAARWSRRCGVVKAGGTRLGLRIGLWHDDAAIARERRSAVLRTGPRLLRPGEDTGRRKWRGHSGTGAALLQDVGRQKRMRIGRLGVDELFHGICQ